MKKILVLLFAVSQISTSYSQGPTILSVNTIDLICAGDADGQIEILATGGTPPLSYSINNGANFQQSNIFISLAFDIYDVIVRDSLNLDDVTQVVIGTPQPLHFFLNPQNIICYDSNDGEIAITPVGGTSPYIYGINGIFTTSYFITNLSAGSYAVDVMDGNGCVASDSVLITQAPPIDTSLLLSGLEIISNQDLANYQWLDCTSNFSIISNETNQNYSLNSNGFYAVEISVGGCIDTSACINIANIGLEESGLFADVSIFHNPITNMVTLELGSLSNVSLRVIDINGRLIHQNKSINSSVYQVEINGTTGIYFILLSSQGQQANFEIPIE